MSKNNKKEKFLYFISSILDIKKLEKYWNNSLNIINKNKNWKHFMQCNLFWDDVKKEIINTYKFENILQHNSLFAYDDFYNFFIYKQHKLYDEKILHVTLISPISWLFINSFYLKFLDEFNDENLKNEAIHTFYPNMNIEEEYLYSWKQFKDCLKTFINKKFLKIDIKNFYSNINIDYFIYFCYQNYEYVKNNYMDFMWIFNLISYYSENDSFPFLENCPFLSFCSSKLFLRKKLIDFIDKFKYKNFIEKIIHYVDDIFVIFNDEWNDNEINDFYYTLVNIFNENTMNINYSKTKYGILTIEDIEKNIYSIEIIKKDSPSDNDKKITYHELNEYLTLFNEYLQNNKNKLFSFFDVERSINSPRKLKDFVFLDKKNILGDINSLTFFENINSKELIEMINYMPKYFIYIFDKFLANYNSNNNPFKLIVKEWENLSAEIWIYYSMLKTFKKIEKNTSEIHISRNNFNSLLKLKDSSWINGIKTKNNSEIQNMFFQSYYLYKKSNKYKYLIMFISSCSVVIEMLNKIRKKICKCKRKKCKKNVYMCENFMVIEKSEKTICNKIKKYRDNNSLIHTNFESKEVTINIDLNIDETFSTIKKILFYILEQ